MSFFSEERVTVEIDKENRVTVRKLPFGVMQNAMSASMVFESTIGDGGGQVFRGKMDPFALKRQELYSAVVAWEGPGFEGRPVTNENIDSLPPFVVDKIRAAVDELNATISEDEKKS